MPPNILERVPLAPRTTLGLGGDARWFADCRSVDDLHDAVAFARRQHFPFFVLGGGSNTIVPDDGYPGLVIHVDVKGIVWQTQGDAMYVTAAAGENWDGFVEQCVQRRLAGVECLSGIPGTVGATPIQNVGAYGQEVSHSIVRVHLLDTLSLTERDLSADQCGFGYRTSGFKTCDIGPSIVTHVEFRLTPNGKPDISYPELRRHMEARSTEEDSSPLETLRTTVLSIRRSKSMVVDSSDPNSRSAGSFFTNPMVSAAEADRLKAAWPGFPTFPGTGGVKLSAAWLVEHAGFPRGFRVGGAAVSDHHTLALVNKGTTSRELLALSDRIVDEVRRQFGVTLVREPVLMK